MVYEAIKVTEGIEDPEVKTVHKGVKEFKVNGVNGEKRVNPG